MKLRSSIAACLVLLVAGSPAGAHRLDEYLQATLFAIDHDRIDAQMRLTPGVAVVGMILSDIDANGDAVLSKSEQRAYAERVLRDVSLSVDGNVMPLELSAVEVPALDDLKQGVGEVQIRFSARLPHGATSHTLVFQNRHQPRISAYLVNCLVPDDPGVRIGTQRRAPDQSVYEVEFLST